MFGAKLVNEEEKWQQRMMGKRIHDYKLVRYEWNKGRITKLVTKEEDYIKTEDLV